MNKNIFGCRGRMVLSLAALLIVSGFFVLPVAALADTTLQVTQVLPVKRAAISDGTFINGWSFLFDVTVPANETQLTAKFSNWTSGSNTIATANNVRFFSPQSINAFDSTNAIAITAPDTYSSVMNINPAMDIDANSENGQQIQIMVELAVPANTVMAPYMTNYQIKTDAPVVPPVIPSDTTPPVINDVPATITLFTTADAGMEATYISPTANDAVDGATTVTCNPASGSVFLLGSNTVTCTSTDTAGNTAQVTFTVNVSNNTTPPTPPVSGCTNSSATNYSPNATVDDGSCVLPVVMGCTDSLADNYNSAANSSDASCIYRVLPPHIVNQQPAQGPFTAPITFTLESDTLGTTIYYTLDGTNLHADLLPHGQGADPIQSTSVTISAIGQTSIQAIAVKDGMLPSGVMATTFQIDSSALLP